ncbi:DNA repair protein SWI5 homolog [Uloborus diversus]|uniref:DNA repair protein SWI5 homolog n=1 Tax=Uloborus diversus TaxID=327109 RepID=UPI00240A9788|nr:DNA repair protein SWI5 homolog [Uloborus diversus]
MDGFNTPRAGTPQRTKFRRLAASTSPAYRSPLMSNAVKKVDPKPESLPLDDLRKATKELFLKNEKLKTDIRSLEEKGYKEEDLKWYIDKLHEYNEIKDVAQMVMGRIAILTQTTVRKVHESFGMTDSD